MKKTYLLFFLFFIVTSCSKSNRTIDRASSDEGSDGSSFEEFFADIEVPTVTLDDLRNKKSYTMNGFFLYPNKNDGTETALLDGQDVFVTFTFDFNNIDDNGIPLLMKCETMNGGVDYAVGYVKNDVVKLGKATVVYDGQPDGLDYLRYMVIIFNDGGQSVGLLVSDCWYDEDTENENVVFEAKVDNWGQLTGHASHGFLGDEVQLLSTEAYSALIDKTPVIKYTSDNGYKLEMQYFRPFKGNKLNAKAIISSTLSDGEMSEAYIVSVIDENKNFDFTPEYSDIRGTGHWTKNQISIKTADGQTLNFTREK